MAFPVPTHASIFPSCGSGNVWSPVTFPVPTHASIFPSCGSGNVWSPVTFPVPTHASTFPRCGSGNVCPVDCRDSCQACIWGVIDPEFVVFEGKEDGLLPGKKRLPPVRTGRVELPNCNINGFLVSPSPWPDRLRSCSEYISAAASRPWSPALVSSEV
jgi:hypothetical protein